MNHQFIMNYVGRKNCGKFSRTCPNLTDRATIHPRPCLLFIFRLSQHNRDNSMRHASGQCFEINSTSQLDCTAAAFSFFKCNYSCNIQYIFILKLPSPSTMQMILEVKFWPKISASYKLQNWYSSSKQDFPRVVNV